MVLLLHKAVKNKVIVQMLDNWEKHHAGTPRGAGQQAAAVNPGTGSCVIFLACFSALLSAPQFLLLSPKTAQAALQRGPAESLSAPGTVWSCLT